MTGSEILSKMRERFGGRLKEVSEKSPKRIYVTIDRADIREMTQFLHFDMGCRFNIASAVDTDKAFEILYHFTKDDAGVVFSVRVFLTDKNKPEIDALTPMMRGAEWIEREIHELFGVTFTGHPNPERLLLPDDWPDGVYPLRRDFVPPKRDDREVKKS